MKKKKETSPPGTDKKVTGCVERTRKLTRRGGGRTDWRDRRNPTTLAWRCFVRCVGVRWSFVGWVLGLWVLFLFPSSFPLSLSPGLKDVHTGSGSGNGSSSPAHSLSRRRGRRLPPNVSDYDDGHGIFGSLGYASGRLRMRLCARFCVNSCQCVFSVLHFCLCSAGVVAGRTKLASFWPMSEPQRERRWTTATRSEQERRKESVTR